MFIDLTFPILVINKSLSRLNAGIFYLAALSHEYSVVFKPVGISIPELSLRLNSSEPVQGETLI